MGKVIGVLLLVFVLVHGFFQVSYGTISPCEAAVERIKKDASKEGVLGEAVGGLIEIGQGLLGKKNLAAELQAEKGMMGCYEIAILGIN